VSHQKPKCQTADFDYLRG